MAAERRRRDAPQRQALLVELVGRQGGRCFHCGTVVELPGGRNGAAIYGSVFLGRSAYAAWKAARRATLDHITPRSASGLDEAANLVAACQWCNWYRGASDFSEAHAVIAELVRNGRHPHQQVLRTGVFPKLTRLGR